MEIVSVFGIDYRLLLIQALNFGVLLFALWWFLYPPIMRMLDERRVVIEKGVRDAEAAKKEKEHAEANARNVIAEATRTGEDIVATARTSARDQGVTLLEEAKQKSDQLLMEASRRAKEEEHDVLKKAEAHVARLAVLGAEKVIRGQR